MEIIDKVEMNGPMMIALAFWTVCLVIFYRSVIKRKREFWKMVIGEDKILQYPEVVVYYWLWLLPITVFMIMLLAILNLDIDQKHIDLIWWVLGFLEAILFGVMLYDYFKGKNDAKSE